MMTLPFFGANAIQNHGTLSQIEVKKPLIFSPHRLLSPPIAVGGNGLLRALPLAVGFGECESYAGYGGYRRDGSGDGYRYDKFTESESQGKYCLFRRTVPLGRRQYILH